MAQPSPQHPQGRPFTKKPSERQTQQEKYLPPPLGNLHNQHAQRHVLQHKNNRTIPYPKKSLPSAGRDTDQTRAHPYPPPTHPSASLPTSPASQKEKSAPDNTQRKPNSRAKERIIRYWETIRIKITLFIAILASVFIFKDAILGLISRYPPLFASYLHVHAQIAAKTLLGLFYYAFLSSLFFIFLPIELIFLYYSNLDYPRYLVFAIILCGNILGLTFNYLTGRLLGKKLLRFLMRKKYDAFHHHLLKWGGMIILIGNIVIFPIEPASVVFGAARYPFRKFFWYSIIGKVIKFGVLLYTQSRIINLF